MIGASLFFGSAIVTTILGGFPEPVQGHQFVLNNRGHLTVVTPLAWQIARVAMSLSFPGWLLVLVSFFALFIRSGFDDFEQLPDYGPWVGVVWISGFVGVLVASAFQPR